MFVQIASDFACELSEVFAFTKTAESHIRVVFKNPAHQDLVIYKEYGAFMLELNKMISDTEFNRDVQKRIFEMERKK